MLLCPVVEVALEPPPLGVRCLDEPCPGRTHLGLGALAVGDVADEAGEQWCAGAVDLRDRHLGGELAAVRAHAGDLHTPV